MKKTVLSWLSCLSVMLLMVAMTSCEGPKGPEGPKGDPGDDGVINWEGFVEGIECGDCHNPDLDTMYYVWARKAQWQQSQHYLGDTYAERNGATCAGCHSTEGLVQRAMAGFPDHVSGIGWDVVTSQPNPSPVGCFACHSPHSLGDFELRSESLAGVQNWSPMEGVADQVINLNDNGNTCLLCHQPRGTSFVKMRQSQGANDTLLITSSRWYPHYGVQGLMFAGNGKGGGFEFSGSTYENSAHASLSVGCPTCHMAEIDGLSGGHSNKIEYDEGDYNVNGCETAGCHTDMDVEEYVSTSASLTGGMGVHEYVASRLDSLHGLLVAEGILNASSGLVNGNNGTSHASSSNPRTFIGPDELLRAGALYNYFFVEHDASHGVHNSKYAVKLLNDAIAEMNN